MNLQHLSEAVRIPPGKRVKLTDYDPGWEVSDELKELGKDEAKQRAKTFLKQNLAELSSAQELLYASDTHAVLVVLQGMDASGKDGTIKHVMRGVNPQGVDVHSFKQPTHEEQDHDFLWRCARRLPERGRIGIFNRSYYEEVLVVRVHEELLAGQRLPPDGSRGKKLWKERFESINNFEQHLVRSGTVVLKFFLNMSREEQKRRFLERIEQPDKQWKFSLGDVRERSFWDDYQRAYEEALSATSTEHAPWYIVPADHKSIARAVVAAVLTSTIRSLDLRFPELSPEYRSQLAEARRQLEQD